MAVSACPSESSIPWRPAEQATALVEAEPAAHVVPNSVDDRETDIRGERCLEQRSAVAVAEPHARGSAGDVRWLTPHGGIGRWTILIGHPAYAQAHDLQAMLFRVQASEGLAPRLAGTVQPVRPHRRGNRDLIRTRSVREPVVIAHVHAHRVVRAREHEAPHARASG